jgi:ABC-2 type transport system ATP-binding protein
MPMQQQTTAATIDSQHVDLVFAPDAGVFDLTYTVPEGSILGMIGPSGCGKTTTVRLALGLLAPQRGSIQVFGRTPTRFGAADREQIGYIPQQFVLYPTLSVAENAEFVASLYGMSSRQVKDRLDQLLPFVDLADARNRPGGKLSGGMQRRLMLASALMHDPILLFADEPTAGIDPVLRGRFWDYFRHLRDEGRTLFVTTQYVGEAAYCDLVAVMRKGRLLVIDTPAGLRRRVLGGEVIELTLADPVRRDEALDLLRRYPPVKDAQPVDKTNNQLRVTVDEAAEWMPEVMNVLEDRDGPQIAVERAQELQISYDEVFIRIMEQAEDGHGQAA